MAVIGRFIGINKYADQNIRELTGAVRDARAMWALLTDNIPEIDSKVILDAVATKENVLNVIEECRSNANDDDSVIFYFSGHGSHDHRLAVHDTFLESLEDSAISMQVIADLFKSSKAKNIICILDCCFSGGAPAKVLEGSPIPKDPAFPLRTIVGEGRLIFSASSPDEPSFELPAERQGIFTKAFIDGVLSFGESNISFPILVDKVLEIVRTKSSQLGITQTPVLFGDIRGGFSFPPMVIGERYKEIFPEKLKKNITASIDDLAQYGFPNELLNIWKEKYPDGLNKLQVSAVNDYGVLDGKDLFVIAPTSSGKTVIGELSTTNSIFSGKKAVFLLPYKALTNEKYQDFNELYGKKLGYRIIRCTGDRLDDTGAFIRGKYDIALLTYEMFLGLVVKNSFVLSSIGNIVIDEAQFITDESRGIVVELILTFLQLSKDKGVHPHLVLLSAVIGESSGFENWLDCQKLVTYERPVPLREGVIDRTGRFLYSDPQTGEKKYEQFLHPNEIVQRRSKPSSQDVIVPLVKKLIQGDEKVIIFRNARGLTSGTAKYLSDELSLIPAKNAIEKLPKADPSSSSRTLLASLSGGTAFHNSNLSKLEREIVEGAFLAKEISVLSATTTLAAGINTPASSVILVEAFFWGKTGKKDFSVAEYKNMVGRAGRLGFNEEGKSFLIAENTLEQEQLFNRYVKGNLESIKSSFKIGDIDNWIIKLLAQVSEIGRADVANLLLRTFGGYLAVKNDPDWNKNIKGRVEEIIVDMVRLGLVDDEKGVIRLTPLGAVCSTSVFSIKSALRLVDAFNQMKSLNMDVFDLMHLVQGIAESDDAYTPMFKRGTSESIWLGIARSKIKNEIFSYLQRNVPYGNVFVTYARFKRILILFDWIDGLPVEQIENKFTKNFYQGDVGRGDIISLADLTRYYLRSAHEISIHVLENPINENDVEIILRRLELGLPQDLMGLVELPFTLERGEYLALFENGIITKEQLLETSFDILSLHLQLASVSVIESYKNSEGLLKSR